MYLCYRLKHTTQQTQGDTLLIFIDLLYIFKLGFISHPSKLIIQGSEVLIWLEGVNSLIKFL
jgi:hypothetical protein